MLEAGGAAAWDERPLGQVWSSARPLLMSPWASPKQWGLERFQAGGLRALGGAGPGEGGEAWCLPSAILEL